MDLAFLGTTYVLGLLTPLSAPCVIPLYPAYLARMARLAGRDRDDARTLAWLGVSVSAGVLLFMTLLGVLFTTVLQTSLSDVIGIVSPVAFALLAVAGVFLMLGKTPKRKVRPILPSNPILGSLVYGFFFGAIIVPCNPALIAFFFTRQATVGDFTGNLLNFLAFGLGIATPLLVLSLLTRASSRIIIDGLIRFQRQIDLVAGAIMTGVSVYYLVYVFEVFAFL